MATKIDQIGYNTRDELIKELGLRLADGMVDVELDREHYDIAINKAIQKYRQSIHSQGVRSFHWRAGLFCNGTPCWFGHCRS